MVDGELIPGKRYEESDFNRLIIIPEREAFRVRLFMDQIDQREKTLVFCATQAHALMVRDLINQMKRSTDPNYCVRVTADDGKAGDEFLLAFRDNEKTIPTILTSSQKLSTGVDARNVRNIVLMRPVNSMIEFKQIVGRGTRLYDGKDYFTIYDFVRAHHHFADHEWDGEPVDPEPTEPRKVRDEDPPKPKDSDEDQRPRTATVKLADGKARRLNHISTVTFLGPDGRMLSAVQFLELLFGALPEFFKDEDELRRLWSDPATRKRLLEGLAAKGFEREKLAAMQTVIDAEACDLFDVLAYVSFASAPITREERATAARAATANQFTDRQHAFIEFVLAQYVGQGVDELDDGKLKDLLKLRYRNAIADAFTDLGPPEQVRRVFIGFQPFLYASNSPHANALPASQG